MVNRAEVTLVSEPVLGEYFLPLLHLRRRRRKEKEIC
jgi:hypothetical protein